MSVGGNGRCSALRNELLCGSRGLRRYQYIAQGGEGHSGDPIVQPAAVCCSVGQSQHGEGILCIWILLAALVVIRKEECLYN